ncbi:hypothetical protein GTW43_11410 [Streptomyces sp. SID5785]|uniref:hypothetical protein n=1 Tax=Streptomyces sp. SID5785 TaxID=2690309 RepID=UPI0013611F83|nr:hypothetical protein [Streptomyces sp. SID5785]MZD05691.1 hypothetical protein [Streptomyces sp. SID5785]
MAGKGAGEKQSAGEGLEPGQGVTLDSALHVRVEEVTYTRRAAQAAAGTEPVRIRLSVRNSGQDPIDFSITDVTWKGPTTAPQSADPNPGDMARLSKNYWPSQSLTGNVRLTVEEPGGVVSFYTVASGEDPAFSVALPRR